MYTTNSDSLSHVTTIQHNTTVISM